MVLGTKGHRFDSYLSEGKEGKEGKEEKERKEGVGVLEYSLTVGQLFLVQSCVGSNPATPVEKRERRNVDK